MRRPGIRSISSRRKRGVALLLTMFFMILLYGVAASYTALIPSELRNALRAQDDSQSFYAADSGISDGIAQMEYQINTNNNNFEDLSASSVFWTVTPSVPASIAVSTTLSNSFATSANAKQAIAVKTYRLPFSDRVSYEVEIQRWAFKVNGDRVPDAFYVTSSAVRDADVATQRRVRRVVHSWCIEKNFSQYAYFVNKLPSDIWLDLNTFRIEGPYHTNNKVLISAPNSWGDGFGSSFLSQLSMPEAQEEKVTIGTQPPQVIDGVKWQNGTPYSTTTGAQDPVKYERMIQGGIGKIHPTSDNISLPEDSSKIETAAFGAAMPTTLNHTSANAAFANKSSVNFYAPTTTGTGAYPALANGWAIDGDVEQIDMSSTAATNGNGISGDDNTNSQWTVTQKVPTYDALGNPVVSGGQPVLAEKKLTITTVYETMTIPAGSYINGNSTPTTSATTLSYGTNNLGYTVLRDDTTNSYRVYEGAGNGASYVRGDVNGLSGTNRGRRTLATQMDTGSSTTKDHQILINGSITRADTPTLDPATSKQTGTRPTGVRDQLGLVAYAVRFKKDSGVTRPFTPLRATLTSDNPALVYAAIFAGRKDDPKSTDNTYGGGVGTQNWDTGVGGKWRLYGSITEGTRQVKGTFGTVPTGMSYQYFYDTNFSSTSPPFFPGTSGIRMVTWTEEPFRQQ